MSIDRREDAGDFYPGGKVISTWPVATGGDVKHSDFAGLDVKTNTIPDLREAVRELGRRLGATVSTALAVCVAIGATVEKAKLNDLDFDANPSVVTNVTFEGLAESSNVYTKGETEAKIVELAPAPGDYANVSNKAVNAVQIEADPNVPAWAKKTVGDFYSYNLYSLVNRDFYAKDSSIKSQSSIWLKGSSNPTVTVGRDKLSDNTYPYARQTVLGFSAYEGFDYYAHYRPRGIYIWPWWNEDAANVIAYLFPTNGNGGTFALTSDIPDVPAWALEAQKPTYTAAEVGALPKTGGTVTGEFGVGAGPLSNFQVVPEISSPSSYTTPTMRFSDGAGVVGIIWRIVDGGVAMDVSDILGSTYRIAMPSANGTLALTSDIPDVPAVIENTVTTAYVREKLGVYLYVGADGGIYVHTNED